MEARSFCCLVMRDNSHGQIRGGKHLEAALHYRQTMACSMLAVTRSQSPSAWGAMLGPWWWITAVRTPSLFPGFPQERKIYPSFHQLYIYVFRRQKKKKGGQCPLFLDKLKPSWKKGPDIHFPLGFFREHCVPELPILAGTCCRLAGCRPSPWIHFLCLNLCVYYFHPWPYIFDDHIQLTLVMSINLGKQEPINVKNDEKEKRGEEMLKSSVYHREALSSS